METFGSMVAMKGMGKKMSKYLSDFQFGVRVSGGAEAILHSVILVLSEYHNDGSLAMLTVDFSNAFILVDRSTLLTRHRDCSIGLLHKIKDSCKLLLHVWYLDDGTVIGDSEEVARVLDIIKGYFLSIFASPSSGVSFWGAVAVSRRQRFYGGVGFERAVNAIDLMGLLSQLHDPQSELLLLRSCMVENIVVCGGHSLETYSGTCFFTDFGFGGLGLYSAKLVSSYAFVASRAQFWVLQDHILRDSGICGMDDDYVSALACLRDTIPSFDF
ncbi:hypothetical protein Tco_0615401 [Tanacetum coccineum]